MMMWNTKENINRERQLIKNALEFLGNAGTNYVLHRRLSQGMYRWIISSFPQNFAEQVRDALRLMNINTPITIPIIFNYNRINSKGNWSQISESV